MVNVYISFHYLHYSYLLFLIDRPLRQSSFLEFYTSSCSTDLAHLGNESGFSSGRSLTCRSPQHPSFILLSCCCSAARHSPLLVTLQPPH